MGHDTHTSPRDHVTWRLASWAAGLQYEDLPRKVLREVARYMQDSVGCAFGGWRTHDWGIARKVAAQEGGRKACHLLGEGTKLAPLQAAFLNSLAIRALDYNDIYWKQDPSHPSDIIPAPMAAASAGARWS